MPLKIEPHAIEQEKGEFIFPGVRVTEDLVLVSGTAFGDYNMLDVQGILRFANPTIVEATDPSSGLQTNLTLRGAELNIDGGGKNYIELTSSALNLHTFPNYMGSPSNDLIVDAEGADNAFRVQGTGGYAAFNAVPIEGTQLVIEGNLGDGFTQRVTRVVPTTFAAGAAYDLVLRSTGTATRNHGPGMVFSVEDALGGPNFVAGIYGRQTKDSQSGKLGIWSRTTPGFDWKERVYFDDVGMFFTVDSDHVIGGTGTLNLRPSDFLLSLDGFQDYQEQGSFPATPSDGYGRLFANDDGHVYWKNDSGDVFILTSGTAGPAGESLWGQTGTAIYYNDGRVGVGTSSPTGVFHAVGSIGSWHIDDDGSALFGNRASANYFGALDPSGKLWIGAGGQFVDAPPIFIETDGTVGIGTAQRPHAYHRLFVSDQRTAGLHANVDRYTNALIGGTGSAETLSIDTIDYNAFGGFHLGLISLNAYYDPTADTWTRWDESQGALNLDMQTTKGSGLPEYIFKTMETGTVGAWLPQVHIQPRRTLISDQYDFWDEFTPLTVRSQQDYSAVGGYPAFAAMRIATSGSAPSMAAIQMGTPDEETYFGSFNTNISFNAQSGTWSRVNQELGGVILQNEHRSSHTRNVLWIYDMDDTFSQFHEYHLASGTSGQHTIKFNPLAEDIDFIVYDDNVVPALFVQGSDGLVGIGTNAPAAKLHLENSDDGEFLRITELDAQGAYVIHEHYSETNFHPYFRFRRADGGTPAAPSGTVDGNAMGRMDWYGWYPSNNTWRNAVRMFVNASGDWGDGNNGADFTLDATPQGELSPYRIYSFDASVPEVIVNDGGYPMNFRVEGDTVDRVLGIVGDQDLLYLNSVKDTAGEHTGTQSGLLVINTVDNNLKIYADGGWRTLVSW